MTTFIFTGTTRQGDYAVPRVGTGCVLSNSVYDRFDKLLAYKFVNLQHKQLPCTARAMCCTGTPCQLNHEYFTQFTALAALDTYSD